jgi:hypothetical protein
MDAVIAQGARAHIHPAKSLKCHLDALVSAIGEVVVQIAFIKSVTITARDLLRALPNGSSFWCISQLG